VDLNSRYVIDSTHHYIAADGSRQEILTEAVMTTPSVPTISGPNIDVTNPYNISLTYTADPPVLYSSQVTIGDQLSISSSPGTPGFYFNQASFAVGYTSIVFQGVVAGHYIGGPSCSVVNTPHNNTQSYNSLPMAEQAESEASGAQVTIILTQQGTEVGNSLSYCHSVAGRTDQLISAFASISSDNGANFCGGTVDCDLNSIVETNSLYFPGAYNTTDVLSPYYAPIGRFQEDALDYTGTWLYSGTTATVCNAGIYIDEPGNAPEPIGAWNGGFTHCIPDIGLP
jgi:hypothetical protein